MNYFKLIIKFLFAAVLCSCLLFFVPNANAAIENSLLAGGCFWCLEHDLEELPGVLSVESGYTGGAGLNPTYRNHEGHQEAVKVTFNSSDIDFQTLLKSYWRNIDPLDSKGQFCDRGDSYRPVIFFMNDLQKTSAEESQELAAKELSVSIDNLGVSLQQAGQFWIAEEYHQNFAKKNKLKYKFYRSACGRDERLRQVWGGNARKNVDWLS